jgi:hypothetical protein
MTVVITMTTAITTIIKRTIWCFLTQRTRQNNAKVRKEKSLSLRTLAIPFGYLCVKNLSD